MTRYTLLILSLVLCTLTLSTEVRAEGPTTLSYPYGKDWQGVRYGPHRPWWSAGLILGNKPSRMSTGPKDRTQLLIGVEGRYHLSPKLALVLAAHFAGHKVEAGDEFASEQYTSKFTYSESGWQLGADFGLWETRVAHFQIGPRLGLQAMKAEITVDDVDSAENLEAIQDHAGSGWVNSADPFAGATARLGIFATPFVEFGVHAQYEMIYGLQNPAVGYTKGMDTGLELGGYSVVHF